MREVMTWSNHALKRTAAVATAIHALRGRRR